MHCPKCGFAMNRHAEKLLKTRERQDSLYADLDTDGVVASIYYCSNCGKVEAVLEDAPTRSV